MSGAQEASAPLLMRPGGLALTEAAADCLGLRKGHIFLDVGCGRGDSVAFLQESRQMTGLGVERSERMAALAEELHPGIAVIRADAMFLPFPDEHFDVVFSECVLPLLQDPFAAIRESARVVKRNGHFVLSTPVLSQPYSPAPEGLLTMDTLRMFLSDTGFIVKLDRDETACLTQFVADAVFRCGSLKEMIRIQQADADTALFPCGIEQIPAEVLGYRLLIAEKM